MGINIRATKMKSGKDDVCEEALEMQCVRIYP